MSQKNNSQGNIAVILLNLGGPERLEDVEPFLFNLFSDRLIIRLGPAFMQKTIARMPESAAAHLLAKLLLTRQRPLKKNLPGPVSPRSLLPCATGNRVQKKPLHNFKMMA
jgi:hypothetical protein